MKRALFHRTRADIAEGDVGGQSVRGGTTNDTSPTNGKHELKDTEGDWLRAVASTVISDRVTVTRLIRRVSNDQRRSDW